MRSGPRACAEKRGNTHRLNKGLRMSKGNYAKKGRWGKGKVETKHRKHPDFKEENTGRGKGRRTAKHVLN